MTTLQEHPPTLDEIDGHLVCTDVQQVTHDVRSFVLEGPGAVRFEAGQYLTVTVDVEGQRLSRCYSISSPPTRPHQLTITVKRVPGGPVSNWLHDHLGRGDVVHASGPLGVFGSRRPLSAKQLYLSAGSGITPLMSMVRAAVDEDPAGADVVFVHHARTPADLIFRDELAAIHDAPTGIRVVLACEQDARDETWTGHRGRISADHLLQAAPDLHEREVFVCGPPAYRLAVQSLLRSAGVDPAVVHEESYELGVPETAPAAPAPTGVGGFSVELRRSGERLTCAAGTTLLDAADEAGITLPSSCGEGVCGTCKSTLLSGAVEMNPAGGIRPREIAENKILLCCSTPTEDVVLDL